MDDEDRVKPSGCGLVLLYNNVFRRQPTSPRRSASTNSIPTHSGAPPTSAASAAANLTPRRRSLSDEPSLALPNVSKAPAPLNYPKVGARPMQGRSGLERNVSISSELDNMINDHQRSKGSSTLVRASSGNVMLYGSLGNLRAPGAVTPSHNVQDHLPKTAKEMNSNLNAPNRKQQAQTTNGPSAKPEDGDEPEVSGVMCRALSRRLDSEELKRMGNEEFKQGNFAEALALYDRAILIDPEKASYWSNKAAALTGLGKLIEAVAECREAVRLEPSYHKAHLRLGTLYLR